MDEVERLARLFEHAKLSVALEERNRLARDLHDSVTQMLFSASLVAEVLPQIWRRDPESALSSLGELRRLTRVVQAIEQFGMDAVVNTNWSQLGVETTTSPFGVEEAERRVLILENAYYSVISPEGCAAILWRDSNRKVDAAKALKLTAPDLLEAGIVDAIVPEPLGGAHRNHQEMATTLKGFLVKAFEHLNRVPVEELLEQRYQKFRRMGVFEEG